MRRRRVDSSETDAEIKRMYAARLYGSLSCNDEPAFGKLKRESHWGHPIGLVEALSLYRMVVPAFSGLSFAH